MIDEHGGPFSEPVLYGDLCIFLLDYYGWNESEEEALFRTYVIAVSQEDGSLVWNYQFESLDASPTVTHINPHVANGSVFIEDSTVSDDPSIEVLDAESGELTERVELDENLAHLLIDDGTVFGFQHGRYSAINTADFTTEWQQEISPTASAKGPLAASSDTLFNPGDMGVDARNRTTGEREWVRELYGGEVTINDGVGYLVGRSWVLAFDLGDGSIRWEFRPDPTPVGGDTDDQRQIVWGLPVVVDDTVLTVGSGELREADLFESYLYALDRTDGTVQWRTYLGPGPATGPVVAGETVYVKNKVVSTSGDVLDSFDPEYRLTGYPAIGNERVFTKKRVEDHYSIVALE